MTAIGLGVRFIDLVDGDDDRNFGRLGVVDRFQRLRHYAVVRRHYQNHDVGHLGATGAHAGERLMAGGIDEDDLLAVHLHLISANVLSDAAGFAPGDVGDADGVQQRCFAVIDMAHDGVTTGARLTTSFAS